MNIIKQAVSPFGQILAATAIFALILSSFAYAVPTANAVGSISIAGVSGSGTGPYDASGTWSSIGGQPCYNKGSEFRYYIEVVDDLTGDGYDSGDTLLQKVDPAPCDGDFFTGTSSSNVQATNQSWPAAGQTASPSNFNLDSGSHTICAVLKHVNDQGNDYQASDCLDNPVVVPGDQETGTLLVEKVVEGGPKATSTFSFTINGGDSINFNSQGSYATTVPTTGTYTVVENAAEHYDATYFNDGDEQAHCNQLEVPTDQTVTCTITNTYNEPTGPEGSISGMKWNDVSGDGQQSGEGEVGLEGWTIKLYEDGAEVATTTTTTNGSGNYSFTGLADGGYTVCEVQQNGWEQTYPATSTNDGCHDVIITEGQNDPDMSFNFGNQQEEGLVDIEMCKFNELENPVSGWGMTLTNDTIEGTYELQTGDNGCVTQAIDPEEGPWVVYEEDREGWNFVDVIAENGATTTIQGNPACSFFEPIQIDEQLIFTQIVVEDPEFGCDFYNEEQETPDPVCRIGDNLLSNGSFEDPAIEGDWDTTSITDWVITKVSDGTSTLGELWRNFMGGPSDGDQNVELDADEPTQLAQDVTTIPGATYELRFDFSPRPGTDASENDVDALVDGSAIMNVSADGSGNNVTDWTTHTDTFVAGSSTTEIAFADRGIDSSEGPDEGSLIDNAVLCLVDEPDEEEEFRCEISASQNLVNPGSNFNLNWSTTGGVSSALSASISGIGEVATTGATSTSITENTTFTLTVFDAEMEATTTCDVTVNVDTDDGGGGTSGGGGGERIELTEGGGGERVELTEDEPEPEVLGEQVSAVPAVAPATGAGGAASTNPLASAVALIGMLLSFGVLRVTRNA